MAEIRKKVAQDGYEGMDKPLEAKSGSQDPAVAPKRHSTTRWRRRVNRTKRSLLSTQTQEPVCGKVFR